jgi:hypothetical protein
VYVLDGTVTFTLAEAEQIYRAGLFVIPRGCSHGFANRSAHPAGILPVATPGVIGLAEEMFRLERAGQAGAQAGLDHAAVGPGAVAAVYARYDSELVGD